MVVFFFAALRFIISIFPVPWCHSWTFFSVFSGSFVLFSVFSMNIGY